MNLIRNAVIALAVAVGLAGAAQAVEVTLTPQYPVAKVTFPKGWSVTTIERGVESRSPDEEVFLWFEVYRSSESDKVMREHERYFTKQGVRITGAPTSNGSSVAGVTIKATNMPATWKGAPTVLRYLVFDFGPSANRQLLMSVWASPEGDKQHDPAVQSIIDSLKAP